MGNDYRNPQRGHRTTGDDWREDVDFRQQRNRDDYGSYQGTRSRFDSDYNYGSSGNYRGRQDYNSDYGESTPTNWRRRSVNEMEDDYSSGFGSDVGNLGTGSYGASGYDTYRRAQDYGDYGQSRRGNTGMSGYRRSYRPQQDDYGTYSSDYGYRGYRPQSYGFNRPDYGRDYWNQDQRQYGGNYGSSYNQDRHRNDDRDWWDRTRDEVSSWFGDDDAERRRRVDRQEDYRGRGPKGYKRSDERIREDINDRLSDDPYVDASDIEVSVNNSEVTLSGSVYDRSTKRRAEDLVESISGVRNVENRIRVNREESADYKYPTATTSGGATNTNSRVDNGKTRTSSSSAI